MPIRTITTVAELKPWLPSDYTATAWDDLTLQAALDAMHDPRLIAAEVWEDYAQTLPAEGAVTNWSNLDMSATYTGGESPREAALRTAKRHRARSKVKTIRFVQNPIEGDPPEGLEEA